jgi:hypothetical protein
MEEDVTLNELRKEFKKMTESEAYPSENKGIKPIKGYGEKKPTEVARDPGAHDGADVVGAGHTKAKTGENVDSAKDPAHGKDGAVGTGTKPVARGEGAEDAQPESLKADIGSKKAAGEDGGVKRGEGAEEAHKGGAASGKKVETGETKEGDTPYSGFRSKIRNILGIEGNKKILSSPLNDGNKGLNEKPKDKAPLAKSK